MERISHLPEEVIIDILSRLSVKSLLRFKSISPSWHSLISSKHFIRTHLKKSKENPTFAHHGIVSSTQECAYKLHLCSLHSLFFEPFTCVNHGYFLVDYVNLVGSCNGLLCIFINGIYMIIWNPATAESKKLPDFAAGKGYGHTFEYGFGFDESRDDYKVYAVSHMKSQSVAKIYSLKTGSWRRLNDFKHDSSRSGSGKFVCGNLHWTKWKIEMNSKLYISSFDLKNEVYGVVEQPSDILDNLSFYSKLGDLAGCLSMLCCYPSHEFDLWVLKQYGVKDSWSKLMTFSDRYVIDKMEYSFRPHYVTSVNGEILFSDGYNVYTVACNVKENHFRRERMTGCHSVTQFDIYVESLVSINVIDVKD